MKTKALLCILFFVSLSSVLLAQYQTYYQLEASSNGNVYVAGVRPGAITFDNGDELYSNGYYHPLIFFAKYDTQGSILWTKKIDPSHGYWDYPYLAELGTDKDDNLYVSGTFIDSLIFDSLNYLSSSSTQGMYSGSAFLVKLDPQGNFVWGHVPKGAGYSQILKMEMDSSANIYVYGSYTGVGFSMDDMPSLGPSGTAVKNFIAKFNSEGKGIWLRELDIYTRDASSFTVSDFHADGKENLYFTGNFRGDKVDNLAFGNLSLTGHNRFYEIFLAKSDPKGNPLWLRKVETEGRSDFPKYLDVSVEGDVYVSGEISGNSRFGNLPVVYGGQQDIFVAQYDPSGAAQWVRQTNPTQPNIWTNEARSIALNPRGELFSIGYFRNTIHLPPLAPISTNLGNAFLVKYDNVGNALCASSANQNFYDLVTDDQGNAFTLTFKRWIWQNQFPEVIVSKWDKDCNNVWNNRIGLSIIASVDDPLPEGFAKTYPNPTTNTLFIEFEETLTKTASLELYDMSGKLIYREQLSVGTQNKELDLHAKESGLFLLRVITEAGTLNRKIIKM